MFYQLMRKNDIICMVDIDNDGHFIKRGKILNEELCPLQGRIHRNNLSEWWNDRAIPIKQGKIAQMLKNNGIPTPSVFLVKNLGLSLTDYYWIRPINSDLTWEQVNLFDNNFKENLLLGTIQIPNENETLVHQPNSSLQGNLEKTWVIDKGIRKLIKGNHTELSSESINEVLIADALHRQNFPHAKYDLIKIKGKNYDFGCISPLFTSQKRELITAYAVITSEIQPNNISSYEHFINVCEQHGLDRNYVRNFLEFEICIDFIFSNRDRHLTNISVIRDADTLNFISMAPIYDNGKSMFVGKEIGPITDKNMLSQEITSFRPTEYELLKYVQDKNLIDINKLPTLSEINELYHMDHKVSDQRINYTLQTYQKKVDLYDKFMRGQSLSSIKFGYNKGLASIIKE